MIPMRKGTRKKKGVGNAGKNGRKRVPRKPARKPNNIPEDPEGLALSKNDILEFCDRVLKKWQKEPMHNSRNIPAMLAVRTSVFFSDEASLAAIWSEIVSWVYQLLYENAQAQARREGLEWADVFSKIKG